MADKIKLGLLISVMGILTLGSTGSYAISSFCPDPSGYPLNGCSLPEKIDGSFPYFDQTVSVAYKDKDTEDDTFNISGESLKGSLRKWLQIDDETTDVIPKMKFKLDVKAEDTVASDDVEISGKIPDLGLRSRSCLHPNPVPVPASIWLFTSGLLGLVAISRRRSNKLRG
jgi:hypothetical protein